MPDPIIVAPEGELDLARVGEFRLQLFRAASEAEGGLVVDFSDVSFVDSSALTALLDVQNRFRRVNRGLAVVAPRGSAVAVVLGLTGLRERLALHETREDAARDVESD